MLRLLLIASLMLSLSMAGVYPQLMARSGRTTVDGACPSSQVCCCGTKDGRCCGMACCQRAIPKPDKAPASPNRTVERGPPLALVAIDEMFGESTTMGAWRYAMLSSHNASQGSISLVASSVRLNV